MNYLNKLISESTNICQYRRLGWPVTMMLGYVKNSKPVLSHRGSHRGGGGLRNRSG